MTNHKTGINLSYFPLNYIIDAIWLSLGGKYAEEIYRYARMALNKDIQFSRYEMQQTALQLLAKHACQWDRFIFRDYEVSNLMLFSFRCLTQRHVV